MAVSLTFCGAARTRDALLLSIEDAIEQTPDETSRAALLARLRRAMEDR